MTAARLSPDLVEMVEAVRIESVRRFVVGDAVRDVAGQAVREMVSTADVAGLSQIEILTEALSKSLYDLLYSRRGVTTGGRRLDATRRRRHLALLSAANSGRGTFEPGWTIRRREDDGRIAVRRGRVTYWASPEEVRAETERDNGDLRCRVRVAKERRGIQPGFYFALGDAEEATTLQPHQLRLYWHLRPGAGVELVRIATRRLNEARRPFKLKVLTHPATYRRADAGVLYLRPDTFDETLGEIAEIYHALRDGLRPEVPRLTRPLAPGLGVAEGPADGGSFGEDRCRRIATVLVRAFIDGRETPAQRADAVARAFDAAGLDPSRPHLASASGRRYVPLEIKSSTRRERPARARNRPRRGAASPGFLSGARRLGETLCREALWQDGRCNWFSEIIPEHHPENGTFLPTRAALGADLYDGTAGLGLVLAELAERTGDDAPRRTARGAFAQALGRLAEHRFEAPANLAFFGGRLGIAWAASRAAERLDDGELAERSAALLADVMAEITAEEKYDLIGGNAGATLGLLDLHRTTADDRCLAVALALGEELLEAAERDGDAWSWPRRRNPDEDPGTPSLTGISHGASGFGLALAELAAVTGRADFRAAAAGAFRYEDLFFDRTKGNWRDLRWTQRDEIEVAAPRFAEVWCHGAPGILLARLRLHQLDPSPASARDETLFTALATTVRTLEHRLADPDADTSLCHGLSGLVEILLIASQILADPSLRTTAEDAMNRLLDRHGDQGRWPSGIVFRGRNPSLMLGEAGIILALLRLDRPEDVPSVLLPGWPGRTAGQSP